MRGPVAVLFSYSSVRRLILILGRRRAVERHHGRGYNKNRMQDMLEFFGDLLDAVNSEACSLNVAGGIDGTPIAGAEQLECIKGAPAKHGPGTANAMRARRQRQDFVQGAGRGYRCRPVRELLQRVQVHEISRTGRHLELLQHARPVPGRVQSKLLPKPAVARRGRWANIVGEDALDQMQDRIEVFGPAQRGQL